MMAMFLCWERRRRWQRRRPVVDKVVVASATVTVAVAAAAAAAVAAAAAAANDSNDGNSGSERYQRQTEKSAAVNVIAGDSPPTDELSMLRRQRPGSMGSSKGLRAATVATVAAGSK